jgi:pyrroline-5-carboxylate reductase
MTLSNKEIGFIGGGAMAEALAGGLIASGVPAVQIAVAEPRAERRELLGERLGVSSFEDNADAVRDRDVVVLATKPNIVTVALAGLATADLDRSRPLWISIAAGVRLNSLEAGLPAKARIVRAMPNTPALIGSGATGFCGNAATDTSDRADAQTLFESVGVVWEADREELLDAVTGLSGSGPAYAFLFIEALIDAGQQVGLPREAAEKLALQTVYGAAKLARGSELSPAALREQVSSPGGTTLAGLAELDSGELRESLARAVAAATARSVELGKGS